MQKTTVKEELEYWNVIVVFRRLNDYFRYKLRHKVNKDMQGLESCDFTMKVLEKVISGDYSWQRSERSSFIDFVYDVARSEIGHFNRDTKSFVSFDLLEDNLPTYRIKDSFNGF